MALTYTPPGKPGFPLPHFSLPAVSGSTITDGSFSDKKGLLVMFICNHCPYVKAIEQRLIDLGNHYKNSALGMIAICSNDAKDYPEDSFENIQKTWKEKSYPFEYLYDESQQVAKKFGAVCTPDIFLFKNTKDQMQLYYRGRLDDSWKDESLVKQHDLKHAIDLLLSDNPAPSEQIPSMGCSIKWRE